MVRRRTLALALAMLLQLPSAGGAAEGSSFLLDPVAESGVRGSAALALLPNNLARLTLEVLALPSGAAYPARLYAGSCARPSASFGLLGTLVPDAGGVARLSAETVQVAASGARVDLTRDLVADGEHVIAIVDPSAGAFLACGAVPPLAPSPEAAAPTGIEAVDAAVAAVLQGDEVALARLVRLGLVPCGPETPEGFAFEPACEPGEVEGMPVPAFPAAACEGYWTRDPMPLLRTFIEHAERLHAVVRGPVSVPADALLPAADYLVIFTPRADSFIIGLALYVKDNAIVAVEAGCRRPDDLMQHNGQPLPVVIGPGQAAPGDGAAELPSTGLPGVDEVARAVVGGDAKTLAGMVAYTQVTCWSGAPGMGRPPSCEDLGLRPETPIQTLPVATCERAFVPKPDVAETLAGLLGGGAGRLVGVFQPASHPFGAAYETPHYGVVFDQPGSAAGYRAVYLRDGQVASVATGCGTTLPDSALVSAWPVGPLE